MRTIDAGKLIDKVEKTDKLDFTRGEVVELLYSAPTMDVSINHKPDTDLVDDNTLERIRTMGNMELMSFFTASVGYDYETNYEPHMYPTFSFKTQALCDEVFKRMKETRVLGFDKDAFIDKLKVEQEVQQRMIDFGPSADTSYRVGYRDGIKQAMNRLSQFITTEGSHESKVAN